MFVYFQRNVHMSVASANNRKRLPCNSAVRGERMNGRAMLKAQCLHLHRAHSLETHARTFRAVRVFALA